MTDCQAKAINGLCWWCFLRLLAIAAIVPGSWALAQGDETELERRWAQQHLMEAVISHFERLVEQRQAPYQTWKAHKAGAACISWPDGKGIIEPYTPIWGGAWEYDKPDDAAQGGMAGCEKARANSVNAPADCRCELLYRDDDVVLEPPATIVAATVEWLRHSAPPTMCSDWFSSDGRVVIDDTHSCPTYSLQSAERPKFVINQTLSDTESVQSPDIFPAPPVVQKSEIDARRLTEKDSGRPVSTKIWFDPPIDTDPYVRVWTSPFSLPEGMLYSFAIHRVPPERVQLTLSVLKKLEHSKMYGRFEPALKPGVTVPYFNPSDQLARYTRAYDLTQQEVYGAFYLDPEMSHDGLLHGERSTRLWVESAIPVDQNWIPVGQPLRWVTPIAVQTDRALYLYSIETRPKSGGPGMEGAFEGRVLDLSGCAEMNACVEDAERVLAEELTRAFQQAPPTSSFVRNPCQKSDDIADPGSFPAHY